MFFRAPAFARQFSRQLSTRSAAVFQAASPSKLRWLAATVCVGGALAGAAALQVGPSNAIMADAPKAAPTKTAAGVKGGIERTFIAVKPDGTQRGLVGDIISRFERKGYKLVAIKAIVPSAKLAEEHYEDLKSRPFFKGLVDYMTGGKAPVIAMVWEGKDVIRQGRRLIGATNPLEAAPGTIRGDYCIMVGRNIIHGSDSFESATKEISLWFGKSEVYDWEFANAEWVTADN
ncbi:NDK-domain-containing protein [Polychytrium aggregatum]|uniref:NDK-domain-containing protein n=1 Tax=Polychytrium aggregatum TaxID=110093 RepID=UPI0022FE4ABB|nr:NDK-domain-containing protein [Polychytrium aggregatum]KAI9205288.1 NDK-domain-containing protein [Polychytrium aggregatum]